MTSPSNKSNPEELGWEKTMFESYLPMEHKLDYVLKPKHYDKQTSANCIICKIIEYDESVERFEIFRNDNFIVFLNIFPYTPGHLMISPILHKEYYEELSAEEITEFGILTQRCIEMLKHSSRTESFNVGWNQGTFSGGSMKHFHSHIVPRYKNELNFIEIISKTKPIIVSLQKSEKFLQRYTPFLAGEKSMVELFEK